MQYQKYLTRSFFWQRGKAVYNCIVKSGERRLFPLFGSMADTIVRFTASRVIACLLSPTLI
jgi:L-fucose mutarotase/ribose pyranase (RbsD/FucU family)